VNIQYLQHAAMEGAGQIGNWAARRGHRFAGTHWYRGDAAPDAGEIDFLVIMGGGMNIYEHRNHPWLVAEKALIAEVISQGKPVLGVCLGAQLIADVMGGKVYQNPEFEIGWFPIRMLEPARKDRLFGHFPAELTALHWHGDTFELPRGATLLASTEGCLNQAFVCQGNVVGLQFHIEVRPEDVRAFVEGETEPLPEGRYVQGFEEILAGDRHMPAAHQMLEEMLERLTGG
jgi:GMP synthase (glutamine-hydrolysing)